MKDLSINCSVPPRSLIPASLSCKMPGKRLILPSVNAQAAPHFSASGKTTLPPNGVNSRELRAVVVLASSRP
jgi:hypothetical protein